jgi:hypothetical protein
MITRENYEEFFLLYVDDELSPATRLSVERFVADNPDLREEWEALLQCRVQPEEGHGYRDKDALLHHESSLLSLVDGELGEQQAKELEEWVRLHPQRAVELQQLMMTVSRPDADIVFPDKESLYRGSRRRAVLLPWMRAGIAAALLGGVVLLLLPGQHPTAPVASIKKNIQQVVTSPAPVALNPVDTSNLLTRDRRPSEKDEQITVKDNRLTQKERKDKPADPVRPELARESAPGEKEAVAAVMPDPIAPPKAIRPDTSGHAARTAVAEVDVQTAGRQTGSPAALPVVNIPREQSSFATEALQQGSREDETDNSIAFASATPGKNKLRGIFRKVSRAFGKTADRDNEGQRQVLISAFQVGLK